MSGPDEEDETMTTKAHPNGDGDAPRILMIRGDEAWAMGREDADGQVES